MITFYSPFFVSKWLKYEIKFSKSVLHVNELGKEASTVFLVSSYLSFLFPLTSTVSSVPELLSLPDSSELS